MHPTFEHVTRMAIEEVIKENMHRGKFGYTLSDEGMMELTDKLHELFLTSRNLRAAGQKFLSGGAAPAAGKQRPSSTTFSRKR